MFRNNCSHFNMLVYYNTVTCIWISTNLNILLFPGFTKIRPVKRSGMSNSVFQNCAQYFWYCYLSGASTKYQCTQCYLWPLLQRNSRWFSVGICKYKPGYISHDLHGCVKSTVIERRQHQLGRMADFPAPVTFSVFDL